MKASTTFTATVLLAMASNVFSTSGSSPSIGRFSFDYAVVGEGRSRPIQVFDDGEKTYLQFRQGMDIPAFFSADGLQHFMPAQEGPYIVINSVPRDIVAQMGLSRTRITHASLASNAVQASPMGRASLPSPARAPGVQLASVSPVGIGSLLAETAVAPNAWTDNSYAQPRRGDEVVWTSGVGRAEQERSVDFVRGESKLTSEGAKAITALVSVMGRVARVTVVGRDDDSYKEGLGEARAQVLKDALVRAGIPREVIVEKSAAPSDAAITRKGKLALVSSTIRWSDGVPMQAKATAPVKAVPSGQADVARQLAAGLIMPSQAIEQLRNLIPREPAQDLAPSNKWQVRAADGSLEAMLQRWGSSAGWKVLAKGAPDIRINGDAEIERPDFIKAADYAITQAKRAGYRIKADAYSNNVLVLTTEEEAK